MGGIVSANFQRSSEYGDDEDWGAQRQILAEKCHFFRWEDIGKREEERLVIYAFQFMYYLPTYVDRSIDLHV